MTTRIGYSPVIARSTLEAKELAVIDPVVLVFLKIETELLILFATIKSGLPSQSKSAIATQIGTVPVVKSTLGTKELVVIEPEELVFLKIETVLLASFVTTKSGLPSPSTSLMAILFGLFPVVKLTAGAKELAVMVPEVLVFLKIEIVLSLEFRTTKSGLPSPSTSLITTLFAFTPAMKSTWEANEVASMICELGNVTTNGLLENAVNPVVRFVTVIGL
jgi:hypothetical protein